MDDARFDTWTRRQFGLAAGGLASALLGLAGAAESEARQRKRKHCKKGKKRCGKKCIRGTCCPGKSCGASCLCGKTVEGQGACFKSNVLIECIQCASSTECSGGACFRFNCGGVTAVCKPLCDTMS